MNVSFRSVFVLVAAAGAVSMLSGCKPGPKPVDPAPTFGDWIEIVDLKDDPGKSVRLAVPKQKPKQIRQLTIGSDNTFKLTICDPSGKPISGPNTFEGTWALKGTVFEFTTTGENVPDEFKGWKPTASAGAQQIPGDDGATVERLYLADADDQNTIMKRK